MTPEVVAVLAALGPAHRRESLAALRQVLAAALPSAPARIAIVDNQLPGDVEIVVDPLTTLLSGDNRAREFSAWERGLDWLASLGALSKARAVILANDTLHRSYGDTWLRGFTERRTETALAKGGLLGWVDAYPRPIELFGLPLVDWMRTSLLVTRPDTLARLRPLTLPLDDSALFSDDPAAPFRLPSPLSARYRDYLLAWVTGDSSRTPEFPFTWHSAAPLTQATLASHTGKLRSIVCEHYLSARAHAANVPFFDIAVRSKKGP